MGCSSSTRTKSNHGLVAKRDRIIKVTVQPDFKRYAMLQQCATNGCMLAYATHSQRADKEIVLAAVKNDGLSLSYATDLLRGDRDIVVCAVKQTWDALRFASDLLRDDPDVVRLAIESGSAYALKHASPRLRSDFGFVLLAMKHKEQSFEYARYTPSSRWPSWLREKRKRKNLSAVLPEEVESVGSYQQQLQHNPPNYSPSTSTPSDSHQFLSTPVSLETHQSSQTTTNAPHGDEEEVDPASVPRQGHPNSGFLTDRDFILAAIATLGGSDALAHASPSLRSDKAVVLRAVRSDGTSLRFAHPCLRKDAEVCHAAVRESGASLRFCAPKLRADRGLVLSAAAHNGLAIRYAKPSMFELASPSPLRGPPTNAVVSSETNVSKSEKKLQSTRRSEVESTDSIKLRGAERERDNSKCDSDDEMRAFVLACLKKGPHGLLCLPLRTRCDASLMKSAVAQHPPSLKVLPRELRSDRAFVLGCLCAIDRLQGKAGAGVALALKHAGRDLLGDAGFAEECCAVEGGALGVFKRSAPNGAKLSDDRRVVSAAVAQCGEALRFASHRLRADRRIVLTALTNDGLAMRHVVPSLPPPSKRGKKSSDRRRESAANVLTADPEVCLVAVASAGPACLVFAHHSLQDNSSANGGKKKRAVLTTARTNNSSNKVPPLKFTTFVIRQLHACEMFFHVFLPGTLSTRHHSRKRKSNTILGSKEWRVRRKYARPCMLPRLNECEEGSWGGTGGSRVKRLIGKYLGARFGPSFSVLKKAALKLGIPERQGPALLPTTALPPLLSPPEVSEKKMYPLPLPTQPRTQTPSSLEESDAKQVVLPTPMAASQFATISMEYQQCSVVEDSSVTPDSVEEEKKSFDKSSVSSEQSTDVEISESLPRKQDVAHLPLHHSFAASLTGIPSFSWTGSLHARQTPKPDCDDGSDISTSEDSMMTDERQRQACRQPRSDINSCFLQEELGELGESQPSSHQKVPVAVLSAILEQRSEAISSAAIYAGNNTDDHRSRVIDHGIMTDSTRSLQNDVPLTLPPLLSRNTPPCPRNPSIASNALAAIARAKWRDQTKQEVQSKKNKAKKHGNRRKTQSKSQRAPNPNTQIKKQP